MNVGTEDDIYEVFARFGDNTAPISWLGSIRSGSPELGCLAAGLDGAARDRCAYEAPLEEWRPARLVGSRLHDWPSTVVRGLLLAHAGIVRAEAMLASDEPQLRSAGGVFRAEYELHARHW